MKGTKQIKKSRCYETTGNIFKDILLVFEMDPKPLVIAITKATIGKDKNQMEIAKNRITDEEYGKAYKDIMDCYNYINKELIDLLKEYKIALQWLRLLEPSIKDDANRIIKHIDNLIENEIK